MNELYHYGVLGMRWGIRKKISSGLHRLASAIGGKSDTSSNRTSSQHSTSGSQGNKGNDTRTSSTQKNEALTAQEAAKVLAILNMQKSFNQSQKDASKGKESMLKGALRDGLKMTLTTAAAGASLMMLKKALVKRFGQDVVDEMFNKKNFR